MSLPSDHDAGHRGYLFAGFASLFAAAFIDNARGPVLPVLCAQLNIPYETAGLFLMIGNIAPLVVFCPELGIARRPSSPAGSLCFLDFWRLLSAVARVFFPLVLCSARRCPSWDH